LVATLSEMYVQRSIHRQGEKVREELWSEFSALTVSRMNPQTLGEELKKKFASRKLRMRIRIWRGCHTAPGLSSDESAKRGYDVAYTFTIDTVYTVDKILAGGFHSH